MVLFFSHCRMLRFPFIIATLLFSITSADQALIDSICSDTSNPTLCLQVFKDSAGADRVGLGETAADAALKQVTATRDLIPPGAGDGTAFTYYNNIIKLFNGFNGYKTLIANKDFYVASLKAFEALTYADQVFKDPDLNREIHEASEKDKDYISIPLAVSRV